MSPGKRHGGPAQAADDIAGFAPGDEADDEDVVVEEAEAAPAVDLPFTAIDWTAHAGDADGKAGAEVIQTLVRRLPNAPGVYRMMNAAGDVLYVGKARSLKNRVASYVRLGGHTNRIAAMISLTANMEFVTTETEAEALLLEANLIKKLRPRFNVSLRDDKSFPYILIRRDHEVAQIVKHRGARSHRGSYFGPFASAGAVNRTINALQKAFLLLEGGLGFLGSNPRETPKPVLSTRSMARPPVILSPRTGPVMPDNLQLEWQGYQFARYAVRVTGPSGIALERSGLTGGRLAYPADAPPLVPGAAYTLELYSGQTRVDATRFEIADRQRADGVRRDLREIEQALGPDVPPSSRAVVQAGFLASRGFLHDARAVVVTALASDSDQPSLHALLGDLYARTGLQREADEAHDQARLLTTDPPRR